MITVGSPAREAGRMKRDMDLIREILLEVEKLPYTGGFHKVAIEGHSEDEITYHTLLLAEADLIEATVCSVFGAESYLPVRLTWAGHEFLDAAKNDTIWHQAKEAAGKAGGLALGVLKPILIQLSIEAAKGYLNMP
jgi:hypothetical protein